MSQLYYFYRFEQLARTLFLVRGKRSYWSSEILHHTERLCITKSS